MEYTVTRHFAGNREKAFDLISSVFISNGYKQVSRDARSLNFEGEAGASTRSRAFLGATSVTFSFEDDMLTLHARMGGVRKMATLIVLLPVALAVLFLVTFGILFGEMGPRFIAMVSLGPVLPWMLLAPFLINWLKKRSHEALEKLLESIVRTGEASG